LLFLDIAHRKFDIFGLTLRASDVPGLVFVFAVLAFGMLFVTSVWGRVWCGWACPQTVFIDGVFRRIEKWVEGSHLERRKLDSSPISVNKVFKKTLKWSLFTLAAVVITHSFLAYFVGSRTLLSMITSSPKENWTSFLFIFVSTAVILFDFAWFREQFCTIVCPYGRFQSLLIDSNTKVVGYDYNRGEPRKGTVSGIDKKQGDCVSCFRCVQVCPTGIDIRRGLQMECINCTACMDACDDVMTKTKKPVGLIRYTSERELKGGATKLARARTIIYGALFSLSVLALSAFVLMQKPVDTSWLRARGAPYDVIRADGAPELIVNRFQVELTNKTDEQAQLTIALAQNIQGVELVTALNPYTLQASQIGRADVFIKAPRSQFKNGILKLTVEVRAKTTTQTKELTLVGPFS
jgi:cytochrome c oxidase accessory protein FixG